MSETIAFEKSYCERYEVCDDEEPRVSITAIKKAPFRVLGGVSETFKHFQCFEQSAVTNLLPTI